MPTRSSFVDKARRLQVTAHTGRTVLVWVALFTMLITGTVSSPAFAATSTGKCVGRPTWLLCVVADRREACRVRRVCGQQAECRGHRGHPLADPLTGAVTSPTLDKGLIYAGSGTWLYLVAGYVVRIDVHQTHSRHRLMSDAAE